MRSHQLRRLGRFVGLLLIAIALVVGLFSPPAISQVPAQERVDEIAADIAGRIGRSMTRPIVVSPDLPSAADIATALADERARGWWGVTLPARSVPDPARPGSPRWIPQTSGRMDTCLIILTLEGELLPGVARDSLLAHEAYHCFQMDLMGIDDYSRLPQWLKEGSATWVGETLVGGSITSDSHWNRYLQRPGSLLFRDYDAVGFFSHLANAGVDVWRELDDLLRLPSELAFAQAASDGGEDFLQTWPMGLVRSPEWGSGWDTSGPGIPPRSIRREATAVIASADRPFRMALEPASQQLIELGILPREIVSVNVTGYGAIRWGEMGSSSPTTRFSNFLNQQYCVGDSCRCEDGSMPAGVQSVSSGAAILAVTSTEGPGSIAVQVVESPCEEPTETSEGSTATGDGSSAEGWRGGDRARGTSFGDPHIVTYDGLRYSFQTVGEFLLSKSSNGRFEVQTRQKQVPGRQLSLNTAVATRLGNHRIALYTQDFPDGRNALWVDGRPATLQNNALMLEDGTAIVKLNDRDYVLQSPTQEQVAIRLIQAGGLPFLNVTPYVPKASGFIGLLGDLNTSPDDDLRIRNGQVLPARSSYSQVRQLVQGLIPSPIPLNQVENAYFEQLYRQFGDSWRISQSESLFDYAPGQSTEAFTNRAFPTTFPTLAGISSAQINSATRTCREAGVEDFFLDGCIFDVAATGQPDFAQAAVNAIADALIQQVSDRVIDAVRDEVEEVLPIRIRPPRLPF